MMYEMNIKTFKTNTKKLKQIQPLDDERNTFEGLSVAVCPITSIKISISAKLLAAQASLRRTPHVI